MNRFQELSLSLDPVQAMCCAHRRHLLLSLAVPMLLPGSARAALPSSKVIRSRMQLRQWAVYRDLLEWAADLYPGRTTVEALAADGLLGVARQAVDRAWPVERASCLLAMAAAAPNLTTDAKLVLVRGAVELAGPREVSPQLAAANLAEVALVFASMGAEPDARRSIELAKTRLSAAPAVDNAAGLWAIARTFSSSTGPVPPWMLTGLESALRRSVVGYEQAQGFRELADSYAQAGQREQFLRCLALAEAAADEVPDRKWRRIATEGIAQTAVLHDEAAIGVRIGGANAVSYELTVYYARSGQRAKALDAHARLPADGLYVSDRGGAAERIVDHALRTQNADDAEFYVDALSESLTLSRTVLFADLVALLFKQHSPAFGRRVRALTEQVHTTTPSPYSTKRDVQNFLKVAQTLRLCEMPKEADEALDLAARHVLYTARRPSTERVAALALVAEAFATQGRHAEAIARIDEASELAWTLPLDGQSQRREMAESLLAIVPAVRVLAQR